MTLIECIMEIYCGEHWCSQHIQYQFIVLATIRNLGASNTDGYRAILKAPRNTGWLKKKGKPTFGGHFEIFPGSN